jgi:hypothetical protein
MDGLEAPREGAVTDRIVEEVAAADGRDALELSPLYDVVDPDALERLVGGAGVSEFSFEYHGYRVSIDGPNEVSISPR